MNSDSILVENYEIAATAIQPGDVALIFFALSSPRYCQLNREMSFEVNVTQTNNVIRESLKRGGSVIFMSSDVVYGMTDVPVDEAIDFSPIGNYGLHKAQVEETWQGTKGFIALRSSLNISLSNPIVQKIISGQDFMLLPGMYRNIVLTSDLIEIILCLLLKDATDWPSAINVGGPDLLSTEEFFTNLSLARKRGKAIRHNWDEVDRASKPARIEINSGLACSVLGRSLVPASSFHSM